MSNYDPLDLRGQERAKAQRELRERLDRENEQADLKWLMSNRRGRRIVWRLLNKSGVFRTSVNTNAIAMAFAEGSRNYGLRMLEMLLDQCPELFPVMIKENTNDGTNDDGNGSNPNQ